MKYIGNYKEIIKEEYINEILNNIGFKGQIAPSSIENKDRYKEYELAIEAGWSTETVYWWRYTNENTSIKLEFPWITSNNSTTWWIVKQTPGQVQPMHVDVDKTNNCRRYWMPLQDYEPGHILINENYFLSGYKKGDVFEFGTALDLHGSANIGLGTRIVLLVTEHL